MDTRALGAGIVPLHQLNEEQLSDMKCERGMLLPINEEYAFNLGAWYRSTERTNNRYPEMEKKRAATFQADIEAVGVLRMPVLNAKTLEVVDGRTRLTYLHQARTKSLACSFAGFEIREFRDEKEVHDYQDRVGMQTRQLSRQQKQAPIKEAIMRHPDWADSRIGSIVQADSETVARLSDKLIEEGLVTRPDQRLGLDGRYTKAIRKKKKEKPARNAEASPLTRFLDAWLERYSYYPVTAADLNSIMADIRFQLDGGSIVTPENHQSMVRRVGVFLHKLAKANISYKSCHLYVRHVRGIQPIFGLIPASMRKPDLENTATKPEGPEEQVPASHSEEEAFESEDKLS